MFVRQDNPSSTSAAAIEELLRQLLRVVHPSVLLSHGLAQAADVKVNSSSRARWRDDRITAQPFDWF